MELSEFKKYANNIDAFDPSEIDEFEFMTEEELDNYQREVEGCTGNLSDYDHIKAFLTMKQKIMTPLSFSDIQLALLKNIIEDWLYQNHKHRNFKEVEGIWRTLLNEILQSN
jgi:hypothetical protein